MNTSAGTIPPRLAVVGILAAGAVVAASAAATPPPCDIKRMFRSPVAIGVGAEPQAVAAGDFNGDGLMDLVSANGEDDDLSIVLGHPSGQFVPGPRLPVGTEPSTLVVTDLDGDGVLDIAVANEVSDDVSVLMGLGGGAFAPEARHAVGNLPLDLIAADLDGDGLPELVTADRQSFRVSVLPNLGSGSFGAAIGLSSPAWPMAVGALDVDRDGVMDIVFADLFSGEVRMHRGLGSLEFEPSVPIVGIYRPVELAVGDLTGDGEPDLAVMSDMASEILLVPIAADGSIGPVESLDFPPGASSLPNGLFTADLNGDGWLDLVVTTQGAWIAKQGAVHVLMSTGEGDFEPSRKWTMSETVTNAVVADFDGDGIPDVAASCEAVDQLRIAYGDGDGTFGAAERYAVGETVTGFDIADVDGDGILDIVTANGGSDDISILRGHGDGTFATEQRLQMPDELFGVAVADLNNDGNADLLSAIFIDDTQTIGVALGLGEGFFGPLTLYGDQDAGFSRLASIEDFDGDGNLDLVAWNSTTNEVVIMLGTGDGGLVEGSRYAIGQRPARVIAADFNVDGHLDLAVPSAEGPPGAQATDTFIMLGRGDGTFELQSPIPDSGPYVSVGDFDQDGVPELVGNGLIFSEVGTDQIRQITIPGISANLAPLGAADFNEDGFLDLIVLIYNPLDLELIILAGDGQGGFEQIAHANLWALEAAVADLNADGAPDFIGVSAYEDDVAVLLHQCPRPTCPADIDASGVVDFGDVLAVVSAWGACPPSGACPADVDGAADGVVDLNDLLLVLASWGPC